MSKLFHIHEDDLAELEKILPQLADALMPVLNNKLRVQVRRVQWILSDVRWDYGPPSKIEVVPQDSPK